MAASLLFFSHSCIRRVTDYYLLRRERTLAANGEGEAGTAALCSEVNHSARWSSTKPFTHIAPLHANS